MDIDEMFSTFPPTPHTFFSLLRPIPSSLSCGLSFDQPVYVNEPLCWIGTHMTSPCNTTLHRTAFTNRRTGRRETPKERGWCGVGVSFGSSQRAPLVFGGDLVFNQMGVACSPSVPLSKFRSTRNESAMSHSQ